MVKRIYREYLEGKPAPDRAWPEADGDSYRGRGKNEVASGNTEEDPAE